MRCPPAGLPAVRCPSALVRRAPRGRARAWYAAVVMRISSRRRSSSRPRSAHPTVTCRITCARCRRLRAARWAARPAPCRPCMTPCLPLQHVPGLRHGTAARAGRVHERAWGCGPPRSTARTAPRAPRRCPSRAPAAPAARSLAARGAAARSPAPPCRVRQPEVVSADGLPSTGACTALPASDSMPGACRQARPAMRAPAGAARRRPLGELRARGPAGRACASCSAWSRRSCSATTSRRVAGVLATRCRYRAPPSSHDLPPAASLSAVAASCSQAGPGASQPVPPAVREQTRSRQLPAMRCLSCVRLCVRASTVQLRLPVSRALRTQAAHLGGSIACSISAACASTATLASFALRSLCTGWQVHCGTGVHRQARGASRLSAEVHTVMGLSYRTSDASVAAMASQVPEAVAGERRAGLYDKAWSYFWRPRQGLLHQGCSRARQAFIAVRGVLSMASVGVARAPPPLVCLRAHGGAHGYTQLLSARLSSASVCDAQAGCAQAPARLLDLPLGRSLRSYGTPSHDAHHGIHRSGIC